MPKIVDKEKMAQSIMTAALQAFVKHGYHKTTMDKIAKEAGIAKGTLYLYFDSKEMLSQSIMQAHFKRVNNALDPEYTVSNLDDLLNHIEQMLMVSKEELLHIPIFFEAFGSSLTSKDLAREIAEFFDKIGAYYAQHLQSLMDQGLINSNINPAILGRALTSMLDGMILHKGLFDLDDTQYKSMVTEIINLFRRGLG